MREKIRIGVFALSDIVKKCESNYLSKQERMMFKGALDQINSMGAKNVKEVDIELSENPDGSARVHYGLIFDESGMSLNDLMGKM